MTEGPDKSVIFYHGDLDGINGLMVCYKWLEENLGGYHNIEYVAAQYENVNELAKNYFELHDDYRYILFVDISVNEEMAKSAPTNCFIFDHHDTSEYLKGMNDRFFHDSRYCGAVVAWKALFRKKPTKEFGKLMKLCNFYDLWLGPDGKPGFPEQTCHDLNLLVQKYGHSDFMARFYDGFTGFNREEKIYIKKYWVAQEKAWEQVDKIPFGDDVLMIYVGKDQSIDCNWWSHYNLDQVGYKIVMTIWSESDRMSMRSSRDLDWFHCGDWLVEHITNTNNSKGGHANAGGCSLEGMSSDEVINIGIMLQELCDERKTKKGKHAKEST